MGEVAKSSGVDDIIGTGAKPPFIGPTSDNINDFEILSSAKLRIVFCNKETFLYDVLDIKKDRTASQTNVRVVASPQNQSGGIGGGGTTKQNINGFGDLSSAVTQKFDSGNTSRPQIAAGFKKIDFKPGTVNLDLGGGKFDQGTEYLEEKGVTNLIFDPVNRASEHNKKIYEAVKNAGCPDVTSPWAQRPKRRRHS